MSHLVSEPLPFLLSSDLWSFGEKSLGLRDRLALRFNLLGLLRNFSGSISTSTSTFHSAPSTTPLARGPTLTARMTTAEEKLDALVSQTNSMLKLMETFNRWRPEVDKFTTELSTKLKALTSHVEVLEAQPPSAPPQAPPREEEGWANGHGVVLLPQGSDKGTLVPPQPLANGQYAGAQHSVFEIGESSQFCRVYPPHLPRTHAYHREVRLPKAVFPKFDGTHPRVWKEKYEKYFAMYQVPMHLWSQFATIHFCGSAALWLQTYEAQHADITWVELCVAVESKFGRDLYQNSMTDLL